MTDITIVDGDGHIMEEPNDIWTAERIDYDRWGDWVPRKEVIEEIYDVIHVGGAMIHPGDLLHGDRNGVTTIPHEIAAAVAQACHAFMAAESVVLD